MKIQNDPRNQLWIDLNTQIAKWVDQGEQLILVGDWNSEVSEGIKWMETQGLANTIYDLHRYSDITITYQWSKDCPIGSIYCTETLAANQGGLLFFGRLLGDHRALCIELHVIMILSF